MEKGKVSIKCPCPLVQADAQAQSPSPRPSAKERERAGRLSTPLHATRSRCRKALPGLSVPGEGGGMLQTCLLGWAGLGCLQRYLCTFVPSTQDGIRGTQPSLFKTNPKLYTLVSLSSIVSIVRLPSTPSPAFARLAAPKHCEFAHE